MDGFGCQALADRKWNLSQTSEEGDTFVFKDAAALERRAVYEVERTLKREGYRRCSLSGLISNGLVLLKIGVRDGK